MSPKQLQDAFSQIRRQWDAVMERLRRATTDEVDEGVKKPSVDTDEGVELEFPSESATGEAVEEVVESATSVGRQ